jgi:hypothetical protein
MSAVRFPASGPVARPRIVMCPGEPARQTAVSTYPCASSARWL